MFSDGLTHEEILEIAQKSFHDDGYNKDSEPLFVLLVKTAAAYVTQCRREGDKNNGIRDAEYALGAVMENLECDPEMTGVSVDE